ncbi:MAG: hypothetical protein WCT26_02520 [Candidatus Buchananbacteria bacterium]|jgi:hypothetical protein
MLHNLPALVFLAVATMGLACLLFFAYGRSWHGWAAGSVDNYGNVMFIPAGFASIMASLVFCSLISGLVAGGYPADQAVLQEGCIYEVVNAEKDRSNSYGTLIRMPDTDCLRLFRYDEKLAPGTYKAANKQASNGHKLVLEPFRLPAN